MLTRLKVTGFKNLVDVDVRFGPFTCIAGANGVGKSNLFDAIRFLSLLADNTLIDAALKMRGTNGRTRDIRSLFHPSTDEMSFEAEMIIPRYGKDDLGQDIEAKSTIVRYSLTLKTLVGFKLPAKFPIEFSNHLQIVREELIALKRDSLPPIFVLERWKNGLSFDDRSFISTANEQLSLHAEKNGKNQQDFKIVSLPRTLLSTVNTAEHATTMLARQEMQSWRVFQLESSALTSLDQVKHNAQIQSNGADLAATIYRIAQTSGDPERIYVTLRNKLATLVSDVREILIDYNEGRDEVGLRFKDTSGAEFPARALSDGTLRYLALAVMELDPQLQGIICLEEPENGLHPTGIAALIHLLQDIAVSPDYPIDKDNPMRQVIINTQSPSVIQQIPADSLLIAQSVQKLQQGQRFQHVLFKHMPDTWRDKAPEGTQPLMRGELLTYLNPVPYQSDNGLRLIDREDLQSLLPWSE
jgi:predicted ATPase